MGRGTLRRTPVKNVRGGIRLCGKSTSKLLLKNKITKVQNQIKCSKNLKRFCCLRVLPRAPCLRVASLILKRIRSHPMPGLPRKILRYQPLTVRYHLPNARCLWLSFGNPRATEAFSGEVLREDTVQAVSQAYGSPSRHPSASGKSGSLSCPSGQSTGPSASRLLLENYPSEDEGIPDLGSPQERLQSGRGGTGSGSVRNADLASGVSLTGAPAGSGAFPYGISAQNPGVPQLSSGSSGPRSQGHDRFFTPRHSVAATYTTTTTTYCASSMRRDGGVYQGGQGFIQPDLTTLLQMLFAGRLDLLPAMAPAASATLLQTRELHCGFLSWVHPCNRPGTPYLRSTGGPCPFSSG